MVSAKFRVVVMFAVLMAAMASPVLAGEVSTDAAAAVSMAAAAPVLPTEPGGTWGIAQELDLGIPAAPGGGITSVSCASPGNCGAFGYEYQKNTPDGPQLIVADETAGAWGVPQVIPGFASLDAGGSPEWGGISCASAGNCAVGGTYTTSLGDGVAFVADEANGIWGQAHALTGVASPGYYSSVTSISCAAAGNCTAVGSYSLGAAPILAFIASEVDGAWGPAQVIPGLAGLRGSSPPWATRERVACVAVGYCTVTGNDGNNPRTDVAFLVSETAGSWGNAQAVPGLAALGATGATLLALSCSSAGNCAAGGYYSAAGALEVSFVVDEADGTWGNAQNIQNPAAPDTTTMGFVTSISCPSAGDCAATGYFIYDGDEAFVASEVGGSWGSAQVIPGTTSGAASIAYTYTISCAAPGNCSVGGDDFGGGFVASETDGVWGTAQGGTLGVVESLSCTAPGYCSAGGSGEAGWVMGEGTATTTQLAASTAYLAYGDEQQETLTATVTSPAGGTPTGTVTVTGGTATVCTITLTAGTGSCAPSATSLPVGSYQLAAVYNGDTNYTASISGTSALTVWGAASTTSLALSKPAVTYGNEATEHLTVTVAPQFGGTPTGTVTVTAGTATVCTITLTAGTGSCAPSATSLPVGSYQLAAIYNGDANYAASTSALATMTVTRATSKTSLALAKATITYGQEAAEHLTVTVTPQFGGTPAGKVTLKAGATTICIITLSAGKVTCTLTARQLRPGTYTLIATYGGSTNYHASTSPGKTLKVLR